MQKGYILLGFLEIKNTPNLSSFCILCEFCDLNTDQFVFIFSSGGKIDNNLAVAMIIIAFVMAIYHCENFLKASFLAKIYLDQHAKFSVHARTGPVLNFFFAKMVINVCLALNHTRE